MISIMLIFADFFRSISNNSISQAMIFSNTAMTVEKAAQDINKKNRLPQIRPPIMEINTFGSVMKIRLGPLSGLTPNAKHAGKMIRPAVIATKVSSTATLTDSPSSVLFFSR